jgi:hypothetical protein
MIVARSLVVALVALALAACSSAPPPPAAPHPQQPGMAAPSGDLLPQSAKSAQPPSKPVPTMVSQ